MKINFPDQMIEDILITAFEGGSNFWYNFPDVRMALEIKAPEGAHMSLSEKIITAVLSGVSFEVDDIETGEKLGELNQEGIQRAVQKFLDEERILDPAMDAGDADVFFQFAVMGEAVYG